MGKMAALKLLDFSIEKSLQVLQERVLFELTFPIPTLWMYVLIQNEKGEKGKKNIEYTQRGMVRCKEWF